jgi:chemotaxis protein MotB
MDAQNAGVLKSQIESLIGSSPQFERLRAAVDMQIGDKDMRIEFHDGGGESLFVGETAQLRPEARRLMEGVAALLNKKRAKLSLEGHAPSRGGTGLGQGEWEVSTSRAVALRGALANGGVDDERIIEVKGLGDTKPKIPEDPSNPANRRVAIVMPYDVPDG